jgi:predicted AlkP superfamily pyrophosphatase or phosphodiesterase
MKIYGEYMKTKKIHILFVLTSLYITTARCSIPRLTVIMVVDQFAYHYLYKLKPFFTDGFKWLLNEGIVFENAHYPHAVPETSIGHTALSTGTFAKDHGIIGNEWVNQDGKTIECDDTDSPDAAVFGCGCNMHSYGKSSANILVDGLSDQFVMKSQASSPYAVFSLSIKSRSATATAAKLGKAIWMDKDTGLFTSSKAYFDAIPTWLTQFNDKYKLDSLQSVSWALRYPRTSPAYQFKHIANYAFAAEKTSSIGKEKVISLCANPQDHHKERFAPVYESPLGNHILFDLGRACVKAHMTKKNHLLIWLCLTPLDLVGHHYGPDSLEAIDLLYHLDKELKLFMQDMQKAAGKGNVLFALTSDHGVLPMQGILKEEGIKTAFKISLQEIISDLNALIKKKYGIDSLIINYQPPQFYCDQKKKSQIEAQTYEVIIKDIKKYLMSKPGIKSVWTYHELDILPLDPQEQELECYFKNQRYPGRSGDIFVQTHPYALLTPYPNGTSHASPYNYDTHVPLIIYQKGKFERKKVLQKVYMTQFANTMAQILDTPKPSASVAQLLPGVFEPVEKMPEEPVVQAASKSQIASQAK